MPDWTWGWAAVILLLGMAAVLWFVASGAKQVSSVLARENRVIQLQSELNEQRKQNERNSAAALQFGTAVVNARGHISEFNSSLPLGSRATCDRAADLIQAIVDSLAADLKHTPGESHRCALWILDVERQILKPGYASAGFGPRYTASGRVLRCAKSIAGKAARLGHTIRLDDVRSNDEWEDNPESSSPYKALMCIPLSADDCVWGVVTVDALRPMTDDDQQIGELYSAVLEGVFNEYTRAMGRETDKPA